MFGKKVKLRSDLPAIDVRKKPVKGFFGIKWVPATKKEQCKMKAELMKTFPERYYVDDLGEWNSVKCDVSWIDRFEEVDAFMDDTI